MRRPERSPNAGVELRQQDRHYAQHVKALQKILTFNLNAALVPERVNRPVAAHFSVVTGLKETQRLHAMDRSAQIARRIVEPLPRAASRPLRGAHDSAPITARATRANVGRDSLSIASESIGSVFLTQKRQRVRRYFDTPSVSTAPQSGRSTRQSGDPNPRTPSPDVQRGVHGFAVIREGDSQGRTRPTAIEELMDEAPEIVVSVEMAELPVKMEGSSLEKMVPMEEEEEEEEPGGGTQEPEVRFATEIEPAAEVRRKPRRNKSRKQKRSHPRSAVAEEGQNAEPEAVTMDGQSKSPEKVHKKRKRSTGGRASKGEQRSPGEADASPAADSAP
jgi:hypothetical protein